ncbi:hypothetical protein PIB30_051044 [Stylosanthes scabra]|uniref:Uncharacterized protein n=1 Tax=Stylosanthes scabra TaxID=79078 RepID=A0ABU6QHG9_9FABA|nr:hypothetical protein [Stylosanthes scabra]
MDRMDDQLSFLCYSNQMSNETMYYPYQNTARQFREMEAQGVPVTIANLAIHRHREEEMNRERMRHNQTVQEAASQRAREANKGKAREVVPDSEEEESEEMYSSPSEEWIVPVTGGYSWESGAESRTPNNTCSNVSRTRPRGIRCFQTTTTKASPPERAYQDLSMFQRPRTIALEDEKPGTYGMVSIYPLHRLVKCGFAGYVTTIYIGISGDHGDT